MSQKPLLFEDTARAFKLKSDSALERAYFLFKMIANEPLVRIGTAVTNFALKAHLPVEGLIRATVFDHFCGGVNEMDCLPIIDKMYEQNVCSVLDYSVEGKASEVHFDAALDKVLSIINFVEAKDAIPFGVFKPTGFGDMAIWVKKSSSIRLNAEENSAWGAIEKRFFTACQRAKALGIKLLVDAEESWMQGAADDLLEHLMLTFNRTEVVVFNTLQMYRHDRLDYLKTLHQKATTNRYKIGIKLVRGAYMEKEITRAEEQSYPNPICKSKVETDKNFNAALQYILTNLDSFEIFIGTHNEDSCYIALELMAELGLAKNDPRIWFGQLFGMSDHISFNLAAEGYNVAKYLPFGPVKDVMPYLIRRAEENTSVAGQTTRELELISQERKRRGN